ncbi:hypothetical protein OS493_030666, partial [Desmophyllum pertusum]
TTAQELADYFCHFGHVVETKVISDENQVPKGYGFVTFNSEEDVKNVTEMAPMQEQHPELVVASFEVTWGNKVEQFPRQTLVYEALLLAMSIALRKVIRIPTSHMKGEFFYPCPTATPALTPQYPTYTYQYGCQTQQFPGHQEQLVPYPIMMQQYLQYHEEPSPIVHQSVPVAHPPVNYVGSIVWRKRAHSTKCPCCYSSEEEPENHASAKKEKSKESNQNNGKRTSTRKKVKIIDGDSVNDRKDVSDTTVSPDESVGKTQKGNKLKKATSSETSKKNVTKRKTAPSKQQSVEFTPNGEASSPKKKQSKKTAKPAVKKKSRTGLSVANGEENEGVQGADLIKSKDNLEKTSSGQTQPRPKKLREKNPKLDIQSDVQDIHKNDAEVSREKALNTKQNIAKPRTATPSRNSGTQKQNDQNVVEEETLLSDLKRSSTKGNQAELGKRNKTRGKGIKSVNFLSGSSSELNIKEKDIIPPGGRKRPKNNTNSGSLSERKIHVFDHLFCELKKCPGLSKVTISSAAELLLKVTADKLKNLVPGLPSKSRAKTSVASSKQTEDNVTSSPAKAKASSSVSEPKRRRTESEKPPLHSSSPQKTGPGKSEQVKLSQAAEALVSFRTNPTILRQEKTEADIIPSSRSPDKDITNMNANPEKNSAPKDTYTPDKVAEAPMQSIVTTINELIASQAVNSCYVNAPSQSHAASQLQSGLVVQGPFHQPVRFPPSIEANLQQVANVQQNLLNLSHLTSQLNSAPTGPPQISPRFTAPCSVNPSSSAVMSSRMMNPTGIPNIQALFCRPTHPPNIQTSMAVQSPAPSLSPNSNDQQAHPQQPLKGMEDVVSCVGSRSTANLLWNIKPATPVVYLTSPQTLSGVRARNFIPQSEGHGPLPFTTGVANVQSVGIPKASLNSASTSVLTLGKVTLVSQASPLSTSHAVNMSNQRPILPREQRMPPVFSSGLQSASQLPVTTVVGQIPRNIPPVVRPGKHACAIKPLRHDVSTEYKTNARNGCDTRTLRYHCTIHCNCNDSSRHGTCECKASCKEVCS